MESKESKIKELILEVDEKGHLTIDALQRFIEIGWNPLTALTQKYDIALGAFVKDVGCGLHKAELVRAAYTIDFEKEPTQ